jgi:hypothetical protein
VPSSGETKLITSSTTSASRAKNEAGAMLDLKNDGLPTSSKLIWLELTGVLLAVVAALVPLVLLWSYLGSHFAGGDGKMYLTLISMYLKFSKWDVLITHTPLEGGWNVAIPLNIWFDPAALPFHFMTMDDAKAWSGAICYVCFAVSWYFVMRAANLPKIQCLVISQTAFIPFDPFYSIFGLTPSFALAPWLAIIFALSFLMAGLLLRINDLNVKAVVCNALLVSLIVAYGIYCDPLWTLIIFTMSAIPLGVIVLERGYHAATVSRILVLLISLVTLYVAGPLRFLFVMSANTSRFLEPAVNMHPQSPEVVSAAFSYSQTKVEFLILIIGWILGTILVRNRTRLLPIIALICFATQVAFSILFLFSGLRWVLPIPIYYELAFSGWYVIGAGVGFCALASAIVRGVLSRIWKNQNLGTGAQRIARVLGSIVLLCFVPYYLMVKWEKGSELTNISEPWSPDDEMVDFLAKRLSLANNPEFRGSVVLPFQDYRGSLAHDSILRAFVPTLNEYSQLVTEQMYVTLHDLLTPNRSEILANRLPLYPAHTSGWATLYSKVTAAFGVRYVVSREALDFSSANPAGLVNLKETRFLSQGRGYTPETWHIYELPDPNVGNYSPTTLHKLETASETIATIASPEFDFRNEAIVTDDIRDSLVPLKAAKLSFLRGIARIQAVSDGASLALIPIQYSHCLDLSDRNSRVLRVDLAMVGILFRETLDAEITDQFSPINPACRAADNADIRRLKIKMEYGGALSAQVMHPFAISTVSDFLTNFDKVSRLLQ